MTLSPEQMDEKMEEHFDFERADNIEGVLGTLTVNATHDVVGYPGGPRHGREGARGFYQELFADLSESKVTPIRRLHGKGFIVDESFWEGKAPGRPFGLEGKGRPLSFRLLHVVEFADNGQIQKEQVWLDLAAIFQQLPQDK